jgi:hypothetical protein
MRRISGIIILLLALVSCKKEPADFIWERSFGNGNAWFVGSTADSGIVACGTLNDKPYLIKLSKGKEVIVEYSSGYDGLFSSAWSDTSCFISAGNSNGKMLLECIDNSGIKRWGTTFTTGFKVELTNLYYTGNGNFLALGSAFPDSSSYGAAGLLFVRFDTTGKITVKKEITETNFIAAGSLSVDNSGNIFLPLTRKIGSARSKSSVAKYNSDFQRIWETELYNNPDFGAACKSIILDSKGQIYVTGKIEVSREGNVIDNSFLASLSSSGSVRWKKYMEFTNSGSALLFDSDILMMLNMNCFIISMVDPDDGSDSGLIRMYSVCNSKTTDAFGYDLDFNYDGNILASGERGGNFYLSLKSSPE